jgi:hypothetical protein
MTDSKTIPVFMSLDKAIAYYYPDRGFAAPIDVKPPPRPKPDNFDKDGNCMCRRCRLGIANTVVDEWKITDPVRLQPHLVDLRRTLRKRINEVLPTD